MKYSVIPTRRFQKDLKRAQKRGYDIKLITDIIKKLANGEQLEPRNHDHALMGNWEGYRECHITSDWLLFPPSLFAQNNSRKKYVYNNQ